MSDSLKVFQNIVTHAAKDGYFDANEVAVIKEYVLADSDEKMQWLAETGQFELYGAMKQFLHEFYYVD